ncbi:arabinosylfuranosidase ArfA [Microlunatus soli]|uniref:non-reducing end alpha-L-arabinofuranosidase n=1 Tax=Microlunatus soli TaxID=630515 RepID=A0A1H1RZM2_9ACTN|nr:alpha-N-arabinofuranosidase [Microlunatus soli]SDS41190.1 alpha-N-arabinofuranosidase [Microlunatus soli]
MAKARIVIDPAFEVGAIDRRLFGSFVEHLGRCVYDGIYEPGHSTADQDGFRADVLDLVRELGVSTVRYPGGNFVSGYRWEDGVGPKDERPTRLDLAWHSTETNEVGLHEFAAWAKAAGVEPMMALNLGTRGVLDAVDVLEYSNVPAGSTLSDRRVANGATDPFGITMWCLGNEMDGPWQLGHCSAEDYGKLASRTAKGMRQLDPSVQLVACGSSNRAMPTFGSWEHTVLKHTYDDVDFISCHAYYEGTPGDLESFLASGVDMDRFIESVVSVADGVGAELKNDKSIMISFDEWNVWYQKRDRDKNTIRGLDNWPQAPRILEDVYNVTDAVVVGGLLISLLRHADRVKAASLAQLVNVIAPIMTEPGGDAWRQTTFFPFAETARRAVGASLRLRIDSDTHDTAKYGEVDSIDAAATHDQQTGTSSLFLVNRDHQAPSTITVDLTAFGGATVQDAFVLSDADRFAANTGEDQERVGLTELTSYKINGTELEIELPALSWATLTLG